MTFDDDSRNFPYITYSVLETRIPFLLVYYLPVLDFAYVCFGIILSTLPVFPRLLLLIIILFRKTEILEI